MCHADVGSRGRDDVAGVGGARTVDDGAAAVGEGAVAAFDGAGGLRRHRHGLLKHANAQRQPRDSSMIGRRRAMGAPVMMVCEGEEKDGLPMASAVG